MVQIPRNDCNSTLNLSGVYPRTDYQSETVVIQASNTINVSNMEIQSDGNYEFKAGNSIVLTPNTTIEAGSNVRFHISPCSSTLKSTKTTKSSTFDNALSTENEKNEELLFKDKNLENYDYVTIYPNPSKGIFNILIESSKQKIRKVELFNSMGTRLRVSRNGNHHIVLDLTNLTDGVYFLRINDGENYFYEKLIKR